LRFFFPRSATKQSEIPRCARNDTCILVSAFRSLPCAFCLLLSTFCFLLSAFYFLVSAFLPCIPHGLRSLLQRLPVPDHSFPRIVGYLKVLSQFQRVHGASVLAQATEHAARKVIGEGCQSLLAVFGPGPSHHNQVFRTRQRAEVAGDAE